jgi:hypothetical protein
MAAFGFHQYQQKPHLIKKSIKIVTLILVGLWLTAITGWLMAADPVWKANYRISLRNLVIPSGLIILGCGLAFLSQKRIVWRQSLTRFINPSIILLAAVSIAIFLNKYLPFSGMNFIFPETPVFNQLIKDSGTNRFFGDYTSSVTSNVWLPYHLYSVEGYDSLYLSRYGQLIAAAANQGKLPVQIPRSDANLIANTDDFFRRRLQDLTGTKYILDKNDFPKSNWEPDPNRFPPDRYQLIWQQEKFKIYQNNQVFPRAFLTSNYRVENDSQKILDLIFNPDINLETTVILETNPTIASPVIPSTVIPPGQVDITHYSAQKIELEIKTPTPQFLVLTDAYYPDWQATLDDQPVLIYRADYAFRAVYIPSGDHHLVFSYRFKL